MDTDDSSDLFKGVPTFDDVEAGHGEGAPPAPPFFSREDMADMPREELVEHALRLQNSHARLDADVKFLSWEFRDYQNNLTYFSRAAKLAHKLNASDLDTIAEVAILEIPQYFNCDYAALYLYNLEHTRFELLRSSLPDAECELEQGRDLFLAKLFANHHYPFIIEYDGQGNVIEMDSGAVQAENLPAAWRPILGRRALIFPMRVKQQDSLDPLTLGGLIIGNAQKELEVRDAEVSILFCDLLSSSLYNAQLVQKLADLTIIDPLTQIFNRRHLINQLGSAMVQARRQGHPLCIAMADIDNFKRFNDNYGHICGDEVLRNVASLLKAGIRTGVDVPARYGGEEFVLVMPFTDLNMAMEVANRIRKQIKNNRVIFENRELSVTCSFGVAEYIDGESLEKLVNRADAALYHAKKMGRNRVCAAEINHGNV